MNHQDTPRLSPKQLRKLLLENYGPRISAGPRKSNFVIRLTMPNDTRRTVTWNGTYKLDIGAHLTVTGRAIYQALLTPGQFECIRAVSEPDDRTASFLDEATKTIGLVGHEEDQDDETEHNRPIAATVHFDQDLDADLGMNRSGQWVVQWRTGTTAADTVITRARFAKSSSLQDCPSRQQVETARLIISIEKILPEKNFRPDFHCLDCGRYCPHWLDIKEPSIHEIPIQARWKSFLDRSCGCHRPPSIVVAEF